MEKEKKEGLTGWAYLYLLSSEHYEELENNLELGSDIAKIKERTREDSVCELNLLNELKAEEPDTSRIFSGILQSRHTGLLRKFVDDHLRRVGFSQEVKNPKVSVEKHRIDILIEDDDYAVIIENKLLGAVYQRNQLAKYIRRVETDGYHPSQIFIVIIPNSYYENYLADVRKSVWKLPPDWEQPNSRRKCAWHDDYCCKCDGDVRTDSDRKYCSSRDAGCVDYRSLYQDRTLVLDSQFPDWLLQCADCLDRKEVLLRAALIQFADYIKTIYKLKQSRKYIMEMQEFLRGKLVNKDESLDRNWRIVHEKISQIDDMKNGLEQLKRELAKEMINSWRDSLSADWDLACEDRKSFGLNINGVWCGCWSGCEGNDKYNNGQPFWGFYSDKVIRAEQQKMIEDILEVTGVSKQVRITHGFLIRNSTLRGDERCEAFYRAARKLGYLK